ncbi:MAG: response regulator [candidate division Zixibacteria bacterium]
MNTKKILVVDDEQVIRLMLSSLLRRLGYNAIFSENGKQAIEIYKQYTLDIDIAIIDLQMPEMNGFETFERLKSIDPDIKVIFSSGRMDDQLDRLVCESGSVCLAKPYKMEQLSQALEELSAFSKFSMNDV